MNRYVYKVFDAYGKYITWFPSYFDAHAFRGARYDWDIKICKVS